jgi:hypothetical protein
LHFVFNAYLGLHIMTEAKREDTITPETIAKERELISLIEGAIDLYLNNEENSIIEIETRHQMVVSAAANTLVGAIINLVPPGEARLNYFEDIYKASRSHIQMISMGQMGTMGAKGNA